MAFCAWCGNHVSQVSYATCVRCGNPTNGAQRVDGGGASSGTAIVVGLLVGVVVIAFAGIVAAIAIPNVMTATQRSKQKRTMADLRSIGTALDASREDGNTLPRGSSVAQLRPLLSPKYIKNMPELDGWGTALRYQCWPDDAACTEYAIASAGADRKWEFEALEGYEEGTATNDFDADIVYANGEFMQYPDGIATR